MNNYPRFAESLAIARSRGRLSTNPHLWDRLEGYWPFVQGGGSKLFDVGGHDLHGTLTNMDPADDWVPTKMGWALDFDGSDYVHVGPISTVPNAFTALVLAKRGTVTEANEMILGFGGGGANFAGLLIEEDGDIGYTKATGAYAKQWNGVWTDKTEWHQVVFIVHEVGAPGELQLYFDAIDKTKDNVETASFTNLRIAELVNPTTREFHGQIGSVALWSRALAPSEIQQLYADPHALVRPRSRVFAAVRFARPKVYGSLAHGRTGLVAL